MLCDDSSPASLVCHVKVRVLPLLGYQLKLLSQLERRHHDGFAVVMSGLRLTCVLIAALLRLATERDNTSLRHEAAEMRVFDLKGLDILCHLDLADFVLRSFGRS